MDVQNAGGPVERRSGSVRHARRHQHERPAGAGDVALIEQEGQLAVEDVEGVVLVRVDV